MLGHHLAGVTHGCATGEDQDLNGLAASGPRGPFVERHSIGTPRNRKNAPPSPSNRSTWGPRIEGRDTHQAQSTR
jgi:hypothetical protein